jgi:four helix bundle protein
MQKEKVVDSGGEQNVRDIEQRTFAFASRIVKLYQHLDRKPGAGRIIGQQILRAGTSIGANVEEAQAGQSRADFISKNAIALKESRETSYWLRLLGATGILPEKRLSQLQSENRAIMRIIAAIIVSTKRNRP